MHTQQSYYLLADGGGTKTTVRLVDCNYQSIGEARSTQGNIKTSPEKAWCSINSAIKQILPPNIKLDQVTAVMGMAGFESALSLEAFKRLKPDYIKNLYVLSDAHIACLGAHAGADGALVIVGTGIKGFQIENGHTDDIAGWGFPYSDEGGGAWIGLEAVRHTFQVVDTREPSSYLSQLILSNYHDDPYELLDSVIGATPCEFGQFCAYVIEGALAKDTASCAILQKAATEVVAVIKALENKQQNKLHLPLSLAGGVSDYIMMFLPERIRNRLVKRQGNALDGALYHLKKINNAVIDYKEG
ncbi:hypothetical protein L3V82_05650 [Thiotrichales bacterium 19S3-7]|nr:hypothetical protein [Thiotrichales bacterium 19S3-7]MCF6801578.1 hypothetical protein [Thiotrichales bacterium 19S3-11]